MQTVNLAAVEAARAKLRTQEAAYAARPHCTVSRSPLALALKTLEGIFPDVGSDGLVEVAFDGRLLSFLCNGINSTVPATGTAWPTRYQLKVGAIADVLSIELSRPEVEVGIWQSMLEIDRARCPGVKSIK